MSTIVISHAAGKHHVAAAEITYPRWETWCRAHGFDWRLKVFGTKVRDDRVAWQWEKLFALAAQLRLGNRVVWVDCDAMPTPWAPSMFEPEEECPGEVLGIPIDDPCPHACMPMSGIMWFDPAGLSIVETAMTMTDCKRQPTPEERAIFLALGFAARGLRFEPFQEQAERKKVRRMPMNWLHPPDKLSASTYAVHSYTAPQTKAMDLHCAAIAMDLMQMRFNQTAADADRPQPDTPRTAGA